jgi:riboflavin synthase
LELVIEANLVLKDINLGDSIAINGVCLTVTSYTARQFTVDVMPETFNATSLVNLKIGDPINLESSLRLNGKLGGHFVTGHVDGVGKISQITKADNAINYKIELDKNLLAYCIYKGSIAVDGTSLTIFGIGENWINIALIPHTVKNSVIGRKKMGDLVNIECDMLGKYVINMVRPNQTQSASSITIDTLTNNGFTNN